MSSKGLYERRSPKVPGLEGLGFYEGRSIAIKDNKGSIETIANSSNRIVLRDVNNLSGTAAVTTAGTLTTLSGIPLDPSTVATGAYEALVTLTGDNQPQNINFTIYGRIEESTNAIATWATPAVAVAGDLLSPTLSADIAGFYYVCTIGGAVGGVEPVWAGVTAVGDTIVDGAATWTAVLPQVAFDVTSLSMGDSDNWEAYAGSTVTSDDFDIVCATDPTTNGHPFTKIEFTMAASDLNISNGDLAIFKIERVAIAGVGATDTELTADFIVDQIIIELD